MPIAIYIIAIIATAGVIIRPFKIPEFIFALAGAIALILFRLIPLTTAWTGVTKGLDVYLFLTGMMLLAETAREEQLFDWLAAHAAQYARGAANRLFLLIYGVGTLVTILLSNDATAVVLTPAVAAVVRTARIKNPLPYLFICAFIANAASFVLPISNPANLVFYGSHMPSLMKWLSLYLLPSVVAIISTYFLLFRLQKKSLEQQMSPNIPLETLTPGGKLALWGIIATAIVLLTASAFDIPLGLPTAITGILTSAIVLIKVRKSPWQVIKGVSWSVLPLVAGLFVIVEALHQSGISQTIGHFIASQAQNNANTTAWGSGIGIALVSNLANNLPVGLVAASAVHTVTLPEIVRSCLLIGVDLGPNLSVTGSLATILWLVALRREGITVSGWQFLRIGLVVMTIPLLLTLAMHILIFG